MFVPSVHRPQVKKRAQKNAEAIALSRSASTEDSLILDGLYDANQFVEAVEKYGCNEKGKKIRTPNWFRQYLRFLGDFRISKKGVSGSQQSGKSLACSLLLAYCTIELKLKFMYSYDSQGARDTQVRLNIEPILRAWESAKYDKRAPELMANLEIWQSQSGGLVRYPYSSVNKGDTKSRKGLAKAGGKNVGFQMDGLIDEERSQSPPGARDPFLARLEESSMKPFAPYVSLGTPGAQLGIELDFQQLDHHFYPFYDCTECGARNPLHPKGCLLRPTKKTVGDEEVLQWYTESGKPRQWWHHNPKNPAKTAYVGCSECGVELSDEVRLNAVFRECRLNIKFEVVSKGGQSLDEFRDSLPEGKPTENIGVGVIISPLLKSGNPAIAIIDRGVNTKNAEDWQQQALGLTSEAGESGISIEMIRRSILCPKIEGTPQVTLCALDQGRHEDWLWIADIYLPKGWLEMPITEIQENAIRQVVYGEAINRQNLGEITKRYNVTYGIMDQEPDIPDSVRLSKMYGFELANQRASTAKKDVDRMRREAGGVNYHVWDVRQKDFQDMILANFSGIAADGHPRYRLPEKWEKWLNLLGAEMSPVTHLTSMVRDPETRIWVRPDDHNDDHFFAAMFLEVALALWIKKHRGSRSTTSRTYY